MTSLGKGLPIATEPTLVRHLRRLLLAIIVAVMLGTTADLLLLEHFESAWQFAPLALLGAGLITGAACAATGRAGAIVAWRILMVLFVAAGFLGMALHYSGNVEFQKELDPTLAGWALFVKAITAKAPPALAPAVMVQIGLLGLLYTYSHPALIRIAPDRSGAEI